MILLPKDTNTKAQSWFKTVVLVIAIQLMIGSLAATAKTPTRKCETKKESAKSFQFEPASFFCDAKPQLYLQNLFRQLQHRIVKRHAEKERMYNTTAYNLAPVYVGENGAAQRTLKGVISAMLVEMIPETLTGEMENSEIHDGLVKSAKDMAAKLAFEFSNDTGKIRVYSNVRDANGRTTKKLVATWSPQFSSTLNGIRTFEYASIDGIHQCQKQLSDELELFSDLIESAGDCGRTPAAKLTPTSRPS